MNEPITPAALPPEKLAEIRQRHKLLPVRGGSQDIAALLGHIDYQCGELLRIKRYASGKAIAAKALGHYEEERRWLDLMILTERAGVGQDV